MSFRVLVFGTIFVCAVALCGGSVPLDFFHKDDGYALNGHNDEVIAGITPAKCATLCLQGTTTVPIGTCLSFDYNNNGYGSCILSIASKDTNPGDHIQGASYDYYHKTDILQFFDHYDDKALDGHNDEVISSVTDPAVCALHCIQGYGNVAAWSCRSFDMDNGRGKCILSLSSADTPGASLAQTVPGAYDYYQRKEINFCSAGPCVHGTCTSELDRYSCTCEFGWDGRDCDTADTTPCDPDPCSNGGSCTSGAPGSYSCTCTAGWTGNNCEQDVDECATNHCANDGTCTQGPDGSGTYSCACTAGWTGNNCDQDVNECDPNPCANGGTCTQDPEPGSGTYTCACTAGWTGTNCDQDVNECDPNPCSNGGTCTQDPEPGSGTYTCACTAGWTGNNCDQDVDECAPNPCSNGGTCTQDPEPGSGTYSCACTAGWTGDNCERDVDECDPNPCSNGGSCTQGPDGSGTYSCACTAGWTGNNCEQDVDECDPNPCSNGGVCTEGPDGSGTYSCDCIADWTGDNCNQISPTVTQQPQNQRISLGQTASFSCTVRGEPLGSVSWSHGGTVVTDGERHDISTAPGSAGSYTVIGTLTIRNVERNDYGQYTCTVRNTAGTVTSQPATLTVLEPPYDVRVTVTAQSYTTLQVSWTVGSTGNADIDTSEVRHKRSDATSWSDWVPTGSTGTQGTYDITGLTAATDYDVQVRVNNTEGGSDPVQSSGRTRDAPPGPPSNLQVTSTSHHSISLTWQQPVVTNGVITHYYIQYGPTAVCSDGQLSRGLSTADSTTSGTVPGLIPYTTYSFRVRAFTSASTGDYTDCVTAKTTEFTPTEPTSVELADVNPCNCETANQPRTIELEARWRRPQNVYGELRGYNLKLQQQDMVIYDHNITQGLENDQLTHVLSEDNMAGLEPARRYSLTVSAYNDVYGGEVSTSIENQTSDGCPTAPPVSKMTQEDMCAVNWTEPSGDRGDITGYSVIVTATVLNAGLVSATEPEHVLTSAEQNQNWTKALTELPAYSLIHVTVRAKTCAEGEDSEEITCRVERIERPKFVPPMNLTDSNPTSTSFKVSLPEVSQRSGPISCYQVIVVKMGTGETIDEVTARIGESEDILTPTAKEEGKTVPYIAAAFPGTNIEREVTLGSGADCTDPCCRVGAVEDAPEPGNKELSPGSKYTTVIRAYVETSTSQGRERQRATSQDHTSSEYSTPVTTAKMNSPVVAIIGGTVAAVALLCVLVAGLIFYRKRQKGPDQTGTKDIALTDIGDHPENSESGIQNKTFVHEDDVQKDYKRLSQVVTVQDVKTFLEAHGLKELTKSFEKHDVDGRALRGMNDAILKDLIPKAGPRARLTALLMELRTPAKPDHPDVSTSNLNYWEIPRANLKLGKRLGRGQFGEVRLGEVRNRGVTTTVAVKTLKDAASDSDKRDLLGELEILVTVGHHDNIISLVGALSKDGPLSIVVEYAPNGCLKDWLVTNSAELNNDSDYQNQPVPLSLFPMEQLIKFSIDVASGMSHLAAMECVHRDLAARNVLLGENLEAKVSDFGLSRDIYESSEYVKSTKSKLPLRWMAYESLFYNVYTSQSDIWSFGVLLWEIMTMGKQPYEGMNGKRMMDMIKDGGRLEKPTSCPDGIYTIMTTCWKTLPEDRPSFPQLKTRLDRTLQDFKPYTSLLK